LAASGSAGFAVSASVNLRTAQVSSGLVPIALLVLLLTSHIAYTGTSSYLHRQRCPHSELDEARSSSWAVGLSIGERRPIHPSAFDCDARSCLLPLAPMPLPRYPLLTIRSRSLCSRPMSWRARKPSFHLPEREDRPGPAALRSPALCACYAAWQPTSPTNFSCCAGGPFFLPCEDGCLPFNGVF
jgi:hypothetical protein